MAFDPVIQLSSLDGNNGFRIDGVAADDRLGFWVSRAGDINGDGIDDLIIGAPFADSNSTNSGSTYVVFGSTGGFSPTFNLSSLDGSNGFRLDGTAVNDITGRAVSAAGDINGDGIDDLIIGANGVDSNGNNAGSSYVVFGSTGGFSPTLNLSSLNGSNGFALNGVAIYDNSGWSVSGAGDINGDGIDDLIIGALYADPNGNISGSSYVVFGKTTGFSSSIELSTLDGSNGFRLDGVAAGDLSGFSVSEAGDINGDGIDDLIIGARDADSNSTDSGSSYLVFGRNSGFSPTLNLSSLDGSNGFRLDGTAASERSGWSVSGAGDINGDGFDDLIIGAPFASNNNSYLSGSSYVMFGRNSGFSPTLNLSSLDGSNGFRLDGAVAFDRSGLSVSGAGDINGDGFDDLIIGADRAPNGNNFGASYVVFGSNSGFSATFNLSSLDGSNGFRLDGVAAGDYSGRSVSGAGDINGDGIDDLIIGAPFADPNGNISGSSYIVFGRAATPSKPAVSLTTVDATAAETGGDTGTYRISRDSSSGSLSVELALSGNASASDYTLSNNISVSGSVATVLFADGQSFVDVVLTPVNDPIAELDETLTLSLNANAAYTLGSSISGSVTIAANDQIIGTAANNNLSGTIGNDIIFGLDGNDNIAAAEGNDIVFGGNGNDRIDGDEGNDTLYGGAGNDYFEGSAGNDFIFGEEGDDLLYGDVGADLVWGGLGNDTVSGGTGSDIFVLAAGEGTDVISDFRLGQSDKIGLAGGLTFNDLSFSGNQILFGSQVLATLTGFNTNNLTAASFISV